jgi:hypothetical protein
MRSQSSLHQGYLKIKFKSNSSQWSNIYFVLTKSGIILYKSHEDFFDSRGLPAINGSPALNAINMKTILEIEPQDFLSKNDRKEERGGDDKHANRFDIILDDASRIEIKTNDKKSRDEWMMILNKYVYSDDLPTFFTKTLRKILSRMIDTGLDRSSCIQTITMYHENKHKWNDNDINFHKIMQTHFDINKINDVKTNISINTTDVKMHHRICSDSKEESEVKVIYKSPLIHRIEFASFYLVLMSDRLQLFDHCDIFSNDFKGGNPNGSNKSNESNKHVDPIISLNILKDFSLEIVDNTSDDHTDKYGLSDDLSDGSYTDLCDGLELCDDLDLCDDSCVVIKSNHVTKINRCTMLRDNKYHIILKFSDKDARNHWINMIYSTIQDTKTKIKSLSVINSNPHRIDKAFKKFIDSVYTGEVDDYKIDILEQKTEPYTMFNWIKHKHKILCLYYVFSQDEFKSPRSPRIFLFLFDIIWNLFWVIFFVHVVTEYKDVIQSLVTISTSQIVGIVMRYLILSFYRHNNDEHKSDKQNSDEHKRDEHKSDEQNSDEHMIDRHNYGWFKIFQFVMIVIIIPVSFIIFIIYHLFIIGTIKTNIIFIKFAINIFIGFVVECLGLSIMYSILSKYFPTIILNDSEMSMNDYDAILSIFKKTDKSSNDKEYRKNHP